jgi:hypothetical protein
MNKISTLAAFFGFLTASGAWHGRADDRPRPKPKFTVSKETTYVIAPLDKHGCIDYEAALNQRMGRGIKPADNANVLLWKAVGPRPEGGKMPARFFKLLGIQAPPEKGQYFRTLYQYVKELLQVYPQDLLDDLYEQMDQAGERPWTEKKYPFLAEWIQANAQPLALVMDATRRPKYFSPLVASHDPPFLIAALLPSVQRCRELANVLTVRAMLHLGRGRHDEAWQDLLACHRLGRLVAQGGTLIEGLVGIAINNIAANADVVFLEHTRLSVKQLKACMHDLEKLPPMPSVADKVDLAERFMFLDTVMMINRTGFGPLQGLIGGRANIPEPLEKELQKKIDWDPALRNGNLWYDRLVAAMRLQNRAAREKKLDDIEKELKSLRAKVSDPDALTAALRGKDTTAKTRGKLVGDALIALMVPALRKVQQASDRTEQVHVNLQVAFALAAYQRDHGRYPKELKALAPAYLARVPGDLFSGKALIYRQSEKGYLFYSVGINGRDDQGRSYGDAPPGDDLRVTMPVPKK